MAIRVLARLTCYPFVISACKPIVPFENLNHITFSAVRSLSREFSQESQCRKIISVADVLQRNGFPSSQLDDYLAKNRFLLNSTPSEIDKSLKLLFRLKSSQEFLVSTMYNCPQLLDFEFLKNWEMGLGITNANASSLMIQNILEVARKFSLGPEDLSRFVQRLKRLGFSDGTVIRVLEDFPMVILMNENGIDEIIEFLLGIGIERFLVDRIFNLFPSIVACEVQNKLKPLLHEFEDLGFSLNVVRREILRDPSVLGLELGELSRCLGLLRSLKCRISIKEKIFSQGAFRAALKVRQRVDCLCRYGLIRRDAFKVLWKEPRAIVYEMDDIEKKIDFLVHRMKFDVLWLVDVPEFVGVNFDKQIVPRYSVIEYLRSKGGIGSEIGLKGLIKLSRLRFYNLYVKPYPECEKMFDKFAGGVQVRTQHPAGIWKLFKPKKYPESKEDLKNIKSFMESLT